jgi:regulatory protein YycI of two-component signal transduction system YycFG
VVKVWALMKFLILFLIVIFILFAFRFFQKKSDNQTIKNKKDDIVDLEKDPKTNEYKPKE